jgi:hypothetical protein
MACVYDCAGFRVVLGPCLASFVWSASVHCLRLLFCIFVGVRGVFADPTLAKHGHVEVFGRFAYGQHSSMRVFVLFDTFVDDRFLNQTRVNEHHTTIAQQGVDPFTSFVFWIILDGLPVTNVVDADFACVFAAPCQAVESLREIPSVRRAHFLSHGSDSLALFEPTWFGANRRTAHMVKIDRLGGSGALGAFVRAGGSRVRAGLKSSQSRKLGSSRGG